MKILYHHRIASRDGQAVHLEELIAALRAQGHEIVLVGPPSFEQQSFGGEVTFIARLKAMLPGAIYELLELAYNLVAYRRIDQALRQHKPDIIYERFNLALLAGIWARRRHKIPLLLEINAPLAEERLANKELALPAIGRWCQRWIWNGADYALPVTGVLADYVRRYGVPDERIVVIPNGINPTRFGRAPAPADAKARLKLEGRLVLGFTGFIRAWHALDRVVDFVATHGERFNLHFLVMGDGPARAELEAHAARRGVSDRVTVTGVVARDDVPNYVAAFDIALQPGITVYASPLKMFEYMFQGTAIVAPDMANIREVLTHEQDGLLFDPKQPEAMSAAILRLCENPGERTRLGAAARRTIETKGFKWDHNATRVIELARKARAGALGGA